MAKRKKKTTAPEPTAAKTAVETKVAAKKTAKPKPAKPGFLDGAPLLRYFLLSALVMLVLNAVGGYWAYQKFVLDVERENLNRITLQHAQDQARLVQTYLLNLARNLHQTAAGDTFIAAATEGNQENIERLLGSLRSSMPTLRAVQYFKAGTAALNPDAELPIRFSEIDMLNRGDSRQLVYPEAMRVGQEWRISIVQSIPPAEVDSTDAPAVVGNLFASFSARDALANLNTLDLTLGSTELLQQFKQGDAQVVFQIGQGSAGAPQIADVSNSHWKVRFTPSASLAQQAKVSPAGILTSVMLLLIASLLSCYLIAKTLARRLEVVTDRQAASDRMTAEARAERGTAEPLFSRQKLIEVEVRKEDTRLLGVKGDSGDDEEDDDPLEIAQTLRAQQHQSQDIAKEIFRAYDIRGLVDSQLTPDQVVLIGRAIGSLALEAGETSIIVGRDGRNHSADISEQLIEGINATGCNVINLGMVPTPLVYFAIHELDATKSGVVVTASHNPPQYNGFKVVIKNQPLAGEQILQLYNRIVNKKFASGTGKEDFADLSFQYIERIYSDVALAGEVRLVIDAGNGVTGEIAPRLFSELGCEVTPLYCDIDGNFPNHPADPSVMANLQPLIKKVQEVGADLGIALDGDGDRLGVVTASGQIIMPDRLLMLLAKDIVSRNPGTDVLFDVKSSRDLNTVISNYGGRPIMWKTGHSYMKLKMQETGALLGGELSGHIFIKERWYGFDDGMYVAARLIEIMSLREQSLDDIFESFPALPSTPELKISIAEDKKFKFMQRLLSEGDFSDGRVTSIDGLRVDYPDGWGLVRASNTSPNLTLRFEGATEPALQAIQARFKAEILKIEPALTLDF